MKQLFVILIFFSATAACRYEPGNSSQSEISPPAPAGIISGTVSYRERILLRPGSRVEITLQDVSRADAPATQIAKLEITEPGQVPIPFKLSYDPAKIDSRMSYALQARILGPDGKLLFINDTHTAVITRDAGNHADMMLVAAQSSPEQSDVPSDELAPGMELDGMFKYSADIALFRDCRSGRSFPVEMSGKYAELEHVYLNSGIEAGEELKVKLHGRYLERPGREENTSEVMLIVAGFDSVADTQDCAPPALAELFNTYWRLVSVNGILAKSSADQREAHMVLQEADQSLAGFGGCNRFFGSFEHDAEKLSFSGMGSTMMACPEGMDTEQAFLLALGETNRAVISGEFLELFHDERKLARFEAVYF